MNLFNLVSNAKHFLSMRLDNAELPVKVYDEAGREYDVIGSNCSFSSYNIMIRRVR